MNDTIDYYNKNADAFYESTIDADMSAQYDMFEKRLYAGARILDCGCGSGRDSKYFLDNGYEVVAIDGSEELCKKASELTGIVVINMLFQDIDFEDEFDGVWACASLLHVPFEELHDVFIKISKALKDCGIFYVSFKFGKFEGERSGRFFTDLTEESFEQLINDIPELVLQEKSISTDVRPGREECWLNAVLVKHAINEIAITDKKELTETESVEHLEGEIVIGSSGRKVLRITRNMTDIDFVGSLDRLAQYVNIANIANTIEKGVEYVVQIPAKYQQQFETGEYFINKNKTTGIEWPTLMKKMENGQYRFVDDLPIKQRDVIQGNPFQDMCNSYHNIVMQQQLAQIADTVAETYQSVKMIEVGQQDDRIALIEAGKEQILLAMSIQDEEQKKEMLRLGARDLLVGKEQIGKALARRVEAFEALPDSKMKLFLTSLARSGYLSKKDREVEDIQECYSMYIEATKMLAATFAYTGETAAVEQTFKRSIEILRGIDFDKVKSIGIAHKDVSLDDWFFNHPIEYVEVEKAPCLESAKQYDFVQIEVTGAELLEAIKNGGEEV